MVWFVFCRRQIFQRRWKSSRTIWSTHTKSQMRLYVLRTYGVPTMRICLTLRVSMTFDIWFTIDTVWKLDPNQWFSVTNKTRLFLFVCHFLEGGRCIDFGFYSPLPLSPPRLNIFWCYSRLCPQNIHEFSGCWKTADHKSLDLFKHRQLTKSTI